MSSRTFQSMSCFFLARCSTSFVVAKRGAEAVYVPGMGSVLPYAFVYPLLRVRSPWFISFPQHYDFFLCMSGGVYCAATHFGRVLPRVAYCS